MAEEETQAAAAAGQSEQTEAPDPTLTIDGVEYKLSQLSDEARRMVMMHQEWTVDARKATEAAETAAKAANQLGAAVRHLENQIVATVQKDNEAAQAANEASSDS